MTILSEDFSFYGLYSSHLLHHLIQHRSGFQRNFVAAWFLDFKTALVSTGCQKCMSWSKNVSIPSAFPIQCSYKQHISQGRCQRATCVFKDFQWKCLWHIAFPAALLVVHWGQNQVQPLPLNLLFFPSGFSDFTLIWPDQRANPLALHITTAWVSSRLRGLSSERRFISVIAPHLIDPDSTF